MASCLSEVEAVIILIAGDSHTGKTLQTKRLLEK
jgi:uridine kinase